MVFDPEGDYAVIDSAKIINSKQITTFDYVPVGSVVL